MKTPRYIWLSVGALTLLQIGLPLCSHAAPPSSKQPYASVSRSVPPQADAQNERKRLEQHLLLLGDKMWKAKEELAQARAALAQQQLRDQQYLLQRQIDQLRQQEQQGRTESEALANRLAASEQEQRAKPKTETPPLRHSLLTPEDVAQAKVFHPLITPATVAQVVPVQQRPDPAHK